MEPSESSLRAELRRRLEMQIIAVDLDSFCLDIYPAVHARFTLGMSRPERVNLLLTLVQNDSRIWGDLDKWLAGRDNYAQTLLRPPKQVKSLRILIFGLTAVALLVISLIGARFIFLNEKHRKGMIWLAGGSFQSIIQDNKSSDPAVHVSGFWLDRTEVTVEAYRTYMANPSGIGANCNFYINGREHHPMNCINYFDANKYCHSVGKRLPTEIEWEYATQAPGPQLPTTIKEEACWRRESGTCTVGSFPSNQHDLVDLFGNVWEWTLNLTCSDATASCAQTNEGTVRGGSWRTSSAQYFGPASRYRYPLLEQSPYVGFRCAKDATN